MINGIINLKKEAGMTSHDAVFKLRKLLHEKKIGHGGTLDPDVTGVLPIAVGKATRVIEFMTEAGKVYEGDITFGFSTTTEDASGEMVERTPITKDLTEEAIDAAMRTLTGSITQVPPMYSAVKVNGKKLYEYARAGETVDRPERHVVIKEFVRTSPLEFDDEWVRFSFKVACSKGTYVRTLAVDLGKRLGFASHMSRLERTASAGLKLSEAYCLKDIQEMIEKEDLSFLLPIEYGVSDLPSVELSDDDVANIRFGRFIKLDSQEATLAAYYNAKVVAILEKREDLYKPRKVLLS
ncbi:tRNA pseudouridine(55) synthase TruB [Streptococcus jiangjianxini]|uniref:tRNA pseudouridine(55) synthase TruB n=1 Tax=Streptococcus jiangjianxini TaxID=3161189 RepID=UPI0032EFDA0B